MSSPDQYSQDTPFFFFEITPDASTAITVVSVCLAVAWVAVALRFWTRTMLVKVFGMDDAFMGFTMVLFTIYCGGVLKISVLIDHKPSLTLPELQLGTSLLIMSECFYIVTMIFLKISLAVFFLRIMVRTWQRRVVQFSVFISTVFGTVYFFFAIFQCGAPVTAWNIIRKMLLGQCLNSNEILGMAYTHAAITLVTDLILALIPIAMLQGSQMSRREKLVIYIILSLGTVGVIASALRMQYLKSLVNINPSFFITSLHLTIWSTVEPALGITAACLATLRKLFGWTSQQLTKAGSSVRTKVTGMQPMSNRLDSYGRKHNEMSFPTEASQVELVAEDDIEVDEKRGIGGHVVENWLPDPDIERAAHPTSNSSRGGRINEAYG